MNLGIFRVFKWTLVCVAMAAFGCALPKISQPDPMRESPPHMANPASVNCAEQGGTLAIEKRGDGGEYGVCVFEGNRQCEEWALLHGECPAGGVPIVGSPTPAARYCVISGGKVHVADNRDGSREQTTCAFRNGRTCDVQDYYAGRCNPDADARPLSYDDPFAYCAAVGTMDTPDGRYCGPRLPDSIIQGMIQKGMVSADTPQDFQRNAVWRCMNHAVWVCHFGANLPCLEKADTARVPTPEMENYCMVNPEADTVPAAVTGRATVYEWKCRNGKPEPVRQLLKRDSRGYLADFWHELGPK